MSFVSLSTSRVTDAILRADAIARKRTVLPKGHYLQASNPRTLTIHHIATIDLNCFICIIEKGKEEVSN